MKLETGFDLRTFRLQWCFFLFSFFFRKFQNEKLRLCCRHREDLRTIDWTFAARRNLLRQSKEMLQPTAIILATVINTMHRTF